MEIRVRFNTLTGDVFVIDWNFPCIPEIGNRIELSSFVSKKTRIELIPCWIYEVLNDNILYSEYSQSDNRKIERLEAVKNFIKSNGIDNNILESLMVGEETEIVFSDYILHHFYQDICEYSSLSKVTDVIWLKGGPEITLEFDNRFVDKDSQKYKPNNELKEFDWVECVFISKQSSGCLTLNKKYKVVDFTIKTANRGAFIIKDDNGVKKSFAFDNIQFKALKSNI